jgi:hypothetical protein
MATVGFVVLAIGWGIWRDRNLMSAAQRAIREGPPATIEDRDRRLQVCVKAAGGAEIDEARALLSTQRALQKVTTYSKWRTIPMSALPPVAELNCPEQPVLLQPGVRVEVHSGVAGRGLPRIPAVEQPSKYQVLLFVLPTQEIERLFLGHPSNRRWENEEQRCERHVTPMFTDLDCIPWTRGIYVTPSEIIDEEAILNCFTELYNL